MEAKSYRSQRDAGDDKPFERTNAVVIISYEFADRQIDAIGTVPWDIVVFDEAHRLRNVHKKTGSARAKNLKRALTGSFKVLLTATPLQNSLLELYGLVSIVDERLVRTRPELCRPSRPLGGAVLKERMRPSYAERCARPCRRRPHQLHQP
jgi:SNF2 family DNA or RNA helicase